MKIRAQLFLLGFLKHARTFDTMEQLKVFNLACQHFPELISKAFLDNFESQFDSIFASKALICIFSFLFNLKLVEKIEIFILKKL